MTLTRDRIFIVFSTLLLTIGTRATAATGAVATGNEMKQYVRVTNTQHADVPAGGTVRITNTRDELTIQGWDQPGVEITTVKSSKDELGAADREKATREMESIKIAAELKGNELEITTSLPKAGGFFIRSPHNFELNYLVKVPRNVHLIVEGSGEAHFEDVAGDIHANMHQGEITVRLPQDGQFAIDASSRVGSVISDFAGDTKRRTWFLGQTFAASPQTAHKLYLREGFGDILIFKTYSAILPSS